MRAWILVALLLGAACSDDAAPAGSEYEGLIVAPVDRGPVAVDLYLNGAVVPSTRVIVKSQLSGMVSKVYVATGEKVAAKQKLATVEPTESQSFTARNQLSELERLTGQVELASIRLEEAKLNLDNARKLAGAGAGGEESVRLAELAYSQAKAQATATVRERQSLLASAAEARRMITTIDITSPADFTVMSRSVEVGEIVTSAASGASDGTILFELADLSKLEIEAFLNQVDVDKLAVGTQVDVTSAAFPGRAWVGKVAWISPRARAQEQIRGFDVKVELETASGGLRPGMTVELHARGASKPDVVRAPIAALFRRAGEDVFFVVDHGQIKPTKATIGLIGTEWLEVPSGLAPGVTLALEDPDRFLERKRAREQAQ